MPEIHSNTAILVFALDSFEEMKRKKIRKGNALFSALNKHTLAEVKKTGLPYVQCGGSCQEGNSFGERFSNAIKDLFEQGFENIIALGNDCPQLTKEHILQAASKLSSGKNVVAPSLDGGFNLLGIQKSAFHKVIFEKLSWQTEKLLAETLAYLEEVSSSPELLESFSDLDFVSDLERLATKVKSHSLALYNFFIASLQTFQKYWLYGNKTTYQFLFSIPFNKGSPLGLS